MSETKFTQGPWRHKAESNLGGQVVGIDPARHNGERSVASVHAVDGSAEEHRANIALISSAPELYEALKTARNQVVAFALRSIGADRAEAAVAYIDDALRRARGESGSAG